MRKFDTTTDDTAKYVAKATADLEMAVAALEIILYTVRSSAEIRVVNDSRHL